MVAPLPCYSLRWLVLVQRGNHAPDIILVVHVRENGEVLTQCVELAGGILPHVDVGVGRKVEEEVPDEDVTQTEREVVEDSRST